MQHSGNHLVVGANGGIGSALFARLKAMGVPVWGTTEVKKARYPANTFYLDLTDPPASWDFKNQTFDVVYLMAGICRMNLCEDDPKGTRKVNIDGLQALAKLLGDAGTFVIFPSTNQVFSGDKPLELPTAELAPQNEYGRQKAEMEKWLQVHGKQWAIVRLTKVVEQNMPLIRDWVDKLAQGKNIQAYRDMMLAPVSLRQVLDVFVAVGQKKQKGRYQVSGVEDISYYDLACHLASGQPELVQSVSALEAGVKKIFLPQFTTLDCSSTISLCGAKPPLFTDVLRECFNIESKST